MLYAIAMGQIISTVIQIVIVCISSTKYQLVSTFTGFDETNNLYILTGYIIDNDVKNAN